MNTMTIYIIAFTVTAFVSVIVFMLLFRYNNLKNIKKKLSELERERNLIISTPIMAELSKIDNVVRNEDVEEKCKAWKSRYNTLKDKRFPVLADMVIDVDSKLEYKDIKGAKTSLNNLEMEIYKVRISCDNLLEEIKEITMSEERNRNIITKLKTKYRELEQKFKTNKDEYKDTYKYIELQFENIEHKFQEFEEAMDSNEYQTVSSIVKVLDEMIAHIGVIVEEVPEIVLLLYTIIPSRIKEVKESYDKMLERNYPLSFLKVDYNLEEINKKMSVIEDKLKILNIDSSNFELKTFLDYLDNLFNEFNHEKRSRKVFEETVKDFKTKIIKINGVVSDVYAQIDDIKAMYNLQDKDLEYLKSIQKDLFDINVNYNAIIKELKDKTKPYSKLKNDIIFLSNRLKDVEMDLDQCLKTLGSMQDDEERAREQLDEMTLLLKKCKSKMNSYKLPIISNNYFTELSEANEAIEEVIKELKKTPITIKTLNVRVDTARDLALKLYNTANEMVKTAKLSEMIIVYGNRYRPLSLEIDRGLDNASKSFFKGNYKESLEQAVNSINIVEPDIYKKMLAVYNNEK